MARLAEMADRACALPEAEGMQVWNAIARLLQTLSQAHAGETIDVNALTAEVMTAMVAHRAADTFVWIVSDVLVASRRPAEALNFIERVLAQPEAPGDDNCRVDLWRLKGAAHQALGNVRECELAWQRALAQASRANAQGWLRRWQAPLVAFLATTG
jgi:hypothetical protein